MSTSSSLLGLTQVLAKAREGAPHAGDELYGLVLGQLRQLARKQLRLMPGPRSLEITELVHEAWIKLAQASPHEFEGRSHFFAIAGRAIRDCAVEQARRSLSLKRGGAVRFVNLDEGLPEPTREPAEFLEVEAAMLRLSEVDQGATELIEQWIFVGLSHEEIALSRGVSLSSVRREWRFARAFLAKQLEASGLDHDV